MLHIRLLCVSKNYLLTYLKKTSQFGAHLRKTLQLLKVIVPQTPMGTVLNLIGGLLSLTVYFGVQAGQ